MHNGPLHDDTLVFLLQASRELVRTKDRAASSRPAVQVDDQHASIVLVKLGYKPMPRKYAAVERDRILVAEDMPPTSGLAPLSQA